MTALGAVVSARPKEKVGPGGLRSSLRGSTSSWDLGVLMITTPYTGLFLGGTRAYVALVLSKGFYSICPGCKDLTEDSNVRYNHLWESHPGLTERGGRKNLVA